MTTEKIRHTFQGGTELNQAERDNLARRLERKTQVVDFGEIVQGAREWEREHAPFDRTSKLNLFQYVIEEGTGGALVPFQTPDHEKQIPALYLKDHAHGQLLSRLDFAKKTYERLPSRLNTLNVNWLIQNFYNRDILLRVQDDDQVRALMSADFEPFDNLELLTLIEPFCKDAEVRWYHGDDLTLHVSVTWPNTEEVLKVGDVVQRGIHISNSEVGLRSVTVAGYVYRLLCSNAAIGGGEGGGIRRFRHVGDSDKLRDQVSAAVEETFLESTKMLAQFKASLEKAVDDPYNYLERIAKDRTNEMTQDQFKAAMDAFMLEPDPTLFGVTNAITRAAHVYEGEDKYHMERLGAKVLTDGLKTK
jgi:hypothetical protein